MVENVDPEVEKEKEAQEQKKRKLEEQKTSKWSQFLRDEELIIKIGVVKKKRKLSTRKRQLILTDTPRLLYVDPEKMEIRGEIPWVSQLKAEAASEREFVVSVVSFVFPSFLLSFLNLLFLIFVIG